jgi:hypothetical protein
VPGDQLVGVQRIADDVRLRADAEDVVTGPLDQRSLSSGRHGDLLTALPEETGRQQYELGLQMAHGMALIATRGYVSAVGETFARARQLL